VFFFFTCPIQVIPQRVRFNIAGTGVEHLFIHDNTLAPYEFFSL